MLVQENMHSLPFGVIFPENGKAKQARTTSLEMLRLIFGRMSS